MEARGLTLSRLGARRSPDENLIDRTLRGDPVAFSEVYRRYQKRIYGYCLARSLDPEAAADATQEVFMRLLRAEPGSIDNPRAWLFTVARNVVIDASRKRARTPEDSGIDEDSLAWDRFTAADTADEVLSRSDARDVFLALRTLRPRYRTAIVMRDVHGESAADMADALETTPGAVDTLVSRARDAFGVAYASVRDLPWVCRANTELIYRNLGTGIDDEEKTALAAHLATCERCRAEAKKANNPRHLGALLPFLVPAKRVGYGLIERATLAMRSTPDIAIQTAPVLSQPHTWNLATKVGAGILAAAIVAAPVAVSTVGRSSDSSDPPSRTGTTSTSSSSTWQNRSHAGTAWSSGISHDMQIPGSWLGGWYGDHASPESTWSSGHDSSATSQMSTSESGTTSGGTPTNPTGTQSSGSSSWPTGSGSHGGGGSWSDHSGSSTDGSTHTW